MVAVVMAATAIAPWPGVVAADESASVPPAERNLYLECIVLSGEWHNLTIAINAGRKRAAARVHSGLGARPTYGVRYEPDEIHLFPNRAPANPPPTKMIIDRQTLMMTYTRLANLEATEAMVVGTAQCREVPPEPGLMPFERRSGR
jgi:hypothetical protein